MNLPENLRIDLSDFCEECACCRPWLSKRDGFDRSDDYVLTCRHYEVCRTWADARGNGNKR